MAKKKVEKPREAVVEDAVPPAARTEGRKWRRRDAWDCGPLTVMHDGYRRWYISCEHRQAEEHVQYFASPEEAKKAAEKLLNDGVF